MRRRLRLLNAVVLRDVKGYYRRSILGPLWAILQPLMYMVVFTVIRGIVDVPSEGVPYPIFTFSALVPWTFFSNAIIRSAPSITSNAGIIKKIAVTREIFPAAAVVTALVDLVIASVILLGMMLWYGVPIGASLLWLPPLVLLTVVLALGVGMGMAAVGTYKNDVAFALPFAMQLWLLATPIMYPLSGVPEKWQMVYFMNPMSGIIEGFRTVLVKGTAPDVSILLVSLLGTVVVWVIAWPLFRYMSRYFADVL